MQCGGVDVIFWVTQKVDVGIIQTGSHEWVDVGVRAGVSGSRAGICGSMSMWESGLVCFHQP
jgi:hypothetical protein